jgi:hypothetical protein
MKTSKREYIKSWFLKKYENNKLKPNTFRIIKESFRNIYDDIISETTYLNKNSRISERLFHIFNNIFEVKRCFCEKNLGYLDINRGYERCCKKCRRKGKIKPKLLINKNNILCDYGCGKLANYILSNNKNCCKPTFGKCEAIERKIPRSKVKHKYTYSKWINKYPILKENEELRSINEMLEVQCRECKNWFSPTADQLYFRIKALEDKKTIYKNRNVNSYLFCSNECKEKSLEYRRSNTIETSKKYESYRNIVNIKTIKTIRKHRDKILNIENWKKGNAIDHKFSVRAGFDNNISTDIISHWKNLEVMTFSINAKKHKKCSITIDKLIEEIKKDDKNFIFEGKTK